MGRLFWKFFFAFWLTLLAASFAVGLVLWLRWQSVEVAAGPRPFFLVGAAAATLRNGGLPAVTELLSDWEREDRATVLAVDENGRDLLDRPVPPEPLAEAQRLLAERVDRRSVRSLRAGDGHTYLFFIPAADGGIEEAPPVTAEERARWESRTRFENGARERFGSRQQRREELGLSRRDGDHGDRTLGRARWWLHRTPVAPLAVLIASLVFSAILAWSISRPIRSLHAAFDAVAQGRLDTRVAPRMGARRDEIGDLGDGFDRMAERLERLLAAQRRLLHDVSHELRSPLARLQVAVGLARQNPQKLDATLDRIEREATRVDELVGELLTLSHLEAGTAANRRERLDLVELVAGIADDARFEAQAAGRDVRFATRAGSPGEVWAEVLAEPLHRAVENVIRNAVKFTAEGTTVEVEAGLAGSAGGGPTSEGRFVVTVADHGPGVPAGELAAIFEPFHRGDNRPQAAGFGLGLAIARRAVEIHHGSIHAANRTDGTGLVITISLPLAGLGEEGDPVTV